MRKGLGERVKGPAAKTNLDAVDDIEKVFGK